MGSVEMGKACFLPDAGPPLAVAPPAVAAAAQLQLLLSRDQLPLLPWGCSLSQAQGKGDGAGED